MTWTIALVFLLAGVAGTTVVTRRDPLKQAVATSLFGLVLTLLFLLLRAPTVALAQVAVSAALIPSLVLLVFAKTGGEQE